MPFAAKIAESIGILPCCALNDFDKGVWTFVWFVRPLIAPYFVYGKFGPRVYNVSCISLLAKKKDGRKKKAHHRTNFEADWWPETRLIFGGGGGGGGGMGACPPFTGGLLPPPPPPCTEFGALR